MSDYTQEQKAKISLERDIRDAKNQVDRIRAARHLMDDDTAVAIKIALGGEDYLHVWVDHNDNVRELLDKEEELAMSELRKLQNP